MLTKACLSTPILECAHSNSLNRALNTMNGSMAATSMKQKAAQCLHGAFAIYLASTLSQRTKRKSLILQMARHIPFFKNIMTSIADRGLWCTYGPVRLSFKKEHEDEELLRKIQMENAFDRNAKNPGIPKPVATFAWKILDITEIWVSN